MLSKTSVSPKGGFTLIELMIVICIIGILAAIAIPNFISYRNHSFCSGIAHDADNISDALADYFSNETYFSLPPMAVITAGFNSENSFTYIGNPLTTIYITVTDKSGRCPRGSYYIKTMPASSVDGYAN